jgi:hypothetical protein
MSKKADKGSAASLVSAATTERGYEWLLDQASGDVQQATSLLVNAEPLAKNSQAAEINRIIRNLRRASRDIGLLA